MSIFPTKIILATDGSEEAELAARTAIDLAGATSSELHIVHVEELPRFLNDGPRGRDYNRVVYEELEKEAAERLRKLTWQVQVAGGTVAGAHLGMGGVAEEILNLAEDLGAGLIVVGSRGHSTISRLLMGSVSDSVVRHAHCSVLVVRGDGDGEEDHAHPPGKILLAFDGSKESSEAARTAAEIADATGSELHVVYVLQPERYEPHLGPELWEGWEEGLERAKRHARSWVEKAGKRIRGEGAVEAHLALGKAAEEILGLAEELGVGLIVVGSRGLGGIRRSLIGSGSDSVVRHAHCPVLVVRTGEAMNGRREQRTPGRRWSAAGRLRARHSGVEEER
jgi:nucleotide-binding universal stress UspA family protein